MTDHTADRILYALFCASRDSRRVDAVELARVLGIGTRLIVAGLRALESAGLLHAEYAEHAERIRLTMRGLARAARLDVSASFAELADAPASRMAWEQRQRLHLVARNDATGSDRRNATNSPLGLQPTAAEAGRPRRLARVIPIARPRIVAAARCNSTGR
jgi:hypothetical protein